MSDELEQAINDDFWRKVVPDITDKEIDAVNALWEVQHAERASAASFSVLCYRAGVARAQRVAADPEAGHRARWSSWEGMRQPVSDPT